MTIEKLHINIKSVYYIKGWITLELCDMCPLYFIFVTPTV